MANVLLFGGFVQVLSAAASLKRFGHRIVIAARHDKVARRSRFKDLYIDMDNDSDPTIVEEELVYIIRQQSIDVVIPMEDVQASCLSQIKQSLEEKTQCRCAVMDWHLFEMVSDKQRLLAFCKQNGIAHPKTEAIDDNYDKIATVVGFPALIKPNHSEGSKGIVMVHDKNELQTVAPKIIEEYGESTLQEFIKNDHYYNLMIYRSSKGSFSNHAIIKVLRYYPIKGGSSSFSVAVEDEPMVKMCKNLLNKLNWVGMADFDILEKEPGDYRVIEINPRVPASLRGAEMSGVFFPEIIVEDLLKGEFPVYEYKTGNFLRFFGLDLAWFFASSDRFKCKPSWFRFFGRTTYYEDGGLRDFPAMFTYFLQGVKKQLTPEFRRSKAGLN